MTKLHITTLGVRQRNLQEGHTFLPAGGKMEFLTAVTKRGDQESPREETCGPRMKG